MADERPGHTLQATALVNEVYLRLANADPAGFKDRAHCSTGGAGWKPPLAQAFVEDGLTTGDTLHGLGITPDRNAARYALADDTGREFNVEVQSIAPGVKFTPIRPFKQAPLYRENPASRFWCRYLPDARTLYCNVRAMQNLYIASKELPALVAQHDPDKLVIDLRRNGGGDYTVGERRLVHPFATCHPLIGRAIFSSWLERLRFRRPWTTQRNFRSQTAAFLVGQTIGEKPNSYAEVRNVALPNSHLTARYSTRYYTFSDSPDNTIRPDREIIPSWAEYKAGRDPVLEWVLNSDPKHLR
jgi:hypothetical protein